MIIKGKSVAGAQRLAVHLARTDTNERMEVLETRGVVSDDLRGALKEIEAISSIAKNCERPFYHASINTPIHERMTPEQRDHAIDNLAKALGLEHQPRVVVAHIKEDREHFHIVFARVDIETFRVISDSHNYRTHEQVARQLEREFGHERVQGAHIERDGVSRPERTPSHKQMQQADRTKISVDAAKAHVSQLWRSSEDGKSFQDTLQKSGWMLCKGDRRDFVVFDPNGGVHSLTRVTGAKASDVRNQLADIERDGLPTPHDARQIQQQKAIEQEALKEKLRLERAAISQDQRDQKQALKDAVALTGSQKMVNVEAVQIQRMRRRAAQADTERGTTDDAKQKQDAALKKRRALGQQRKEPHIAKENTDRRVARDAKSRSQPEADATATKQKGKGDREQER